MSTISLLLPGLFCLLIGFAVCWALIPLIRRITGQPRTGQEARSFHHTHKGQISRFGGVALAAAFLAVSLGASFFASRGDVSTDLTVVLSCLAMFALGARDDLRPLSARFKLLVQVAIATGVYLCGLQIEVLKNPLTGRTIELGIWALPMTVFWVVALTNLINLIDGMDGLAGGICLMLMCLLAYAGLDQAYGSGYSFATLLAAGVAGALLAFLRFNFPPARIYMGDGGAYFLGSLIAVLTISTSHKGTVAAGLIAPLFALALPIVDVALAILRRVVSGLPIFRPDQKHIHHRLIQSGLSRRRAVLILYGLSLVCVLMAFAVFWSQGKLVPLLFGVMSLVVVGAARLLGFFRDWYSVRKLLGSSFQLRRESRYALTMIAWLEMEAERCQALQELWTSYLFFTRKLGFAHVRLILHQGTDFAWKNHAGPSSADRLKPGLPAAEQWHRAKHEIALANIRAIEFSAASHTMSAETFQHLAELAAEAWLKAARRWKEASGQSISFEPAIPQLAPDLVPGRVLVANAA